MICGRRGMLDQLTSGPLGSKSEGPYLDDENNKYIIFNWREEWTGKMG